MNCRYMDKLKAKANDNYGEDGEIANCYKSFTTSRRQKLSKLHENYDDVNVDNF